MIVTFKGFVDSFLVLAIVVVVVVVYWVQSGTSHRHQPEKQNKYYCACWWKITEELTLCSG